MKPADQLIRCRPSVCRQWSSLSGSKDDDSKQGRRGQSSKTAETEDQQPTGTLRPENRHCAGSWLNQLCTRSWNSSDTPLTAMDFSANHGYIKMVSFMRIISIFLQHISYQVHRTSGEASYFWCVTVQFNCQNRSWQLMSQQTREYVQCFTCHSYHIGISTIRVTLHVNELDFFVRRLKGWWWSWNLGERAAKRVTGVQDCISETTGYLTFGKAKSRSFPKPDQTKSTVLSLVTTKDLKLNVKKWKFFCIHFICNILRCGGRISKCFSGSKTGYFWQDAATCCSLICDDNNNKVSQNMIFSLTLTKLWLKPNRPYTRRCHSIK